MAETHDFDTLDCPGRFLDDSMTLVGQSGGLSSIYNIASSSRIVTEHGTMIIEPDTLYQILLDGEPRCDVCWQHMESVIWCGNCGCCIDHCQNYEGCGTDEFV